MRSTLFPAAITRLLFLLAVISVLSCGDSYEASKKKRADMAGEGKEDVVVAVVWPKLAPPQLFPEGVELAVGEINDGGGVLGRRLRTIHLTDTDKAGGYFDAEKIAGDPRIVAVVGHYHSDSTLSSIITYEYHGILLLIASATHPLLLEQGFEYVFRATPNDKVFGEQLAQYALRSGYKKMAVIDNSTLYGSGLADIFYQKATDLGLEIVIRRGYLPWQKDLRPLIAEIRKLKFDALFLAGILPRAAVLIRQLRQMDVNAPILAGDALDSQDLIDIAGKAANGTVVPTLFHPGSSDPVYLAFKAAFIEKYGKAPDQYATLGYDIIHLLQAALHASGSSVPLDAAVTLRHMQGWRGVLGNYAFDERGELIGRTICFKQVRNGQFVDMEE